MVLFHRMLRFVVLTALLLSVAWAQEGSDEPKEKEKAKEKTTKTYGEYQGKVLDVFASNQKNADLLGPLVDEHVGQKFVQIFGTPSTRGAVLLVGGDFSMQQFSSEEKALCKKFGAEWWYRGPESEMIALAKDWDNLKTQGPQSHFLAGTFMHYLGVTMLSYHVYQMPPKDKRKEERLRLEKRWDNKYLIPFWFACCWTLYSEPPNFHNDRWNSLKKRFDKGITFDLNRYFSGGYSDWGILYSLSLPVFQYLLELGGPEFIKHMLKCFIEEKGMSEALKWLGENKEKLKLADPPTTLKAVETGFHEWAKKKLAGKSGNEGKDGKSGEKKEPEDGGNKGENP